MQNPAQDLTQQASELVRQFFNAATVGDDNAMRALLSRDTLATATFDSASLKTYRYVIGVAVLEGDIAVVPVKAFADGKSPANDASATPELELPCIVVSEAGNLRLNFAATIDRAVLTSDATHHADAHNAAAQSVRDLGTLAHVVTGNLDRAMKELFETEDDDDKAVDYLAAQKTFAPEELLHLLTTTPLPKQTASLKAICRDETVVFSAATNDLLLSGYNGNAESLISWLDDQQLEGWSSILSLLNAKMPFARRLRGVRVEPAVNDKGRMLVLDGDELVYRINLNGGDGHYNGEYITELLPGVLAGLPIDQLSQGHRLIHLDNELASVDLFKEHAIPRAMRRVCEMLGRNIKLEVDLSAAGHSSDHARQLYRWTLNRMVGGIALACNTPARRDELADELTEIRFRVGTTLRDRYARYEDGILEISISIEHGEVGAFYEIEIDEVLTGEVIGDLPDHMRSFTFDDDDDDDDDDESDDVDDDSGDDDENVDDQEDEDEALYLAVTQSKVERERIAAEKAREIQLNDENFKSASTTLKEHEHIWATQLSMFLGHPATIDLDFTSLNGRFELVQPFIHQGLTGVLNAFGQTLGQPGKWSALFSRIQQLQIAGAAAESTCVGALVDGTLTMHVPLIVADAPPPTEAAFAALELLNVQLSLDTHANTSRIHVHHAGEAKTSMHNDGGFSRGGDPYAYAAQFVKDLERTMIESNMWPGPKPPGEIEIRGAFGMENMAFSQWLGWVLIPRVSNIVETHGNFPPSSNVAAHAVREFDGMDVDDVIEVLRNFDDVVNQLNS